MSVNAKMSLCLINQGPRHEGVWENGGTDPAIFILGNRWRLVPTFMLRPLYPEERAPDILGTKRLGGGAQSRSGRREEKKIISPLAGIEPQLAHHPDVTSCYTD